MAVPLVYGGRQDRIAELLPVRLVDGGRRHRALAPRPGQCSQGPGAAGRRSGVPEWRGLQDVRHCLRLRRYGEAEGQRCQGPSGVGGWPAGGGRESHEGDGHQQLVAASSAGIARRLRCHGFSAPSSVSHGTMVTAQWFVANAALPPAIYKSIPKPFQQRFSGQGHREHRLRFLLANGSRSSFAQGDIHGQHPVPAPVLGIAATPPGDQPAGGRGRASCALRDACCKDSLQFPVSTKICPINTKPNRNPKSRIKIQDNGLVSNEKTFRLGYFSMFL